MAAMKKFIIIFSFIIASSTLAQDTNIIKYLPLQVGNVWVYSNGSTRAKIKILSSLNANGHIYYVFGMTGDSCHCAQGPSTPFLTGLSPMRIDSLTGNIMFYGTSCQWQVNEILLDSLKQSVGIVNYNSCNDTYCYDTNQLNIFGNLRSTKSVGLNLLTYYTSRRYAKGIGLISSVRGCFYSSCGFNLLGCIINGVLFGDTSFPVGINQIEAEVPKSFSLSQNYPNPFNPNTKIIFQIAKSGNAKLTIYDALGREVATLVNEQLQPGTYEAEWDGSNYPSGVYFYKLTVQPSARSERSDGYTETKKLVLIK